MEAVKLGLGVSSGRRSWRDLPMSKAWVKTENNYQESETESVWHHGYQGELPSQET